MNVFMRYLRAPGLQVGAPVSLSVQFTTRVQRNCLFFIVVSNFLFSFCPTVCICLVILTHYMDMTVDFFFSSGPLSYSQLSIIFFFF